MKSKWSVLYFVLAVMIFFSVIGVPNLAKMVLKEKYTQDTDGSGSDRATESHKVEDDSDMPLQFRLAIPSYYSANNFYSSKLRMTTDADIIVPDTLTIPSVRTGQMMFGQDIVTKLYDKLVGDTTMYYNVSELTKKNINDAEYYYNGIVNDPDSTYSEITQAQYELRKLYAMHTENTDNELYLESDRKLKNVVQYAFPRLDTKYSFGGVYDIEDPYNRDGKHFLLSQPGSFSSDTMESTGGSQYYIVKPDNELPADEMNNVIKYGGVLFINAPTLRYYTVKDYNALSVEITQDEWKTARCAKGKLSPNDVKLQVEDIFKSIGEKNIAIDSIKANFYVQAAFLGRVNGNAQLASEVTKESLMNGSYSHYVNYINYTVRCVRTVDGMKLKGLGGDGTGEESITIQISDKGLYYFYWINPSIIMDSRIDTQTLLKFVDIEQLISTMFNIKWQTTAGAMSPLDFHVTKIELALFPESTNSTKREYTCAWALYGEGRQNGRVVFDDNQPLLVIDGVTGKMVE